MHFCAVSIKNSSIFIESINFTYVLPIIYISMLPVVIIIGDTYFCVDLLKFLLSLIIDIL
jgi:hypothetical protein